MVLVFQKKVFHKRMVFRTVFRIFFHHCQFDSIDFAQVSPPKLGISLLVNKICYVPIIFLRSFTHFTSDFSCSYICSTLKKVNLESFFSINVIIHKKKEQTLSKQYIYILSIMFAPSQFFLQIYCHLNPSDK